MSDGEVLTYDKNSFLGYADFYGKRIYRKIRIDNGIVTIEDYSQDIDLKKYSFCLLYTSPSPRDEALSRMPSSA